MRATNSSDAIWFDNILSHERVLQVLIRLQQLFDVQGLAASPYHVVEQPDTDTEEKCFLWTIWRCHEAAHKTHFNVQRISDCRPSWSWKKVVTNLRCSLSFVPFSIFEANPVSCLRARPNLQVSHAFATISHKELSMFCYYRDRTATFYSEAVCFAPTPVLFILSSNYTNEQL